MDADITEIKMEMLFVRKCLHLEGEHKLKERNKQMDVLLCLGIILVELILCSYCICVERCRTRTF